MVPTDRPVRQPCARPPLSSSSGTPDHVPRPPQRTTAGSPSCDSLAHAPHQSRFYFVVFMNGSAPLFHSNRIPGELLHTYTSQRDAVPAEATAQRTGALSSTEGGEASCAHCSDVWLRCAGRRGNPCQSPTPGSSMGAHAVTACGRVVGEFADNAVGVEEVPQQTLQSIAFPSSFASALAGPSLTRRTPGATRLTTPAPELAHRDAPRMGHSYSNDNLYGDGRGAPTGTAATDASPSAAGTTSSPETPREPPFNLRLEEVRNTKGELRCCRVVATASFTTLLSSHTAATHAMQTRSSAVALVITCPGTGQHYAFLQQHPTLVQALTYRVVHFGMRTMQRFFSLLLAGTGAGARAPQLMRNVTAILERHQEALETYYELRRQIAAAFALCLPLPPLRVPPYPTARGSQEASQVPLFIRESFLAHLNAFPRGRSRGGSGRASFALVKEAPTDGADHFSLSEYLFAALTRLEQFSDAFTSAVAAGVFSLCTPSGPTAGAAATTSCTPAGTALSGPRGSPPAPSPFSQTRTLAADPYEAFWAQRTTEERRVLGKPPHPVFQPSASAQAERRDRPWRGLTTVGSLATVSDTTSGLTSPVSPLSNAPTVSHHASWATAPPLPPPQTFTATDTERRSPSPLPSSVPDANTRAGTMPTGKTGTAARHRSAGEGFALGGERSGRILIFTRDAELAWCLLLLSATFLNNEARHVFEGHASGGVDRATMRKWERFLKQGADTSPHGGDGPPSAPCELPAWLRSAQESFAAAFAGQTASSVFVGVPIQWIPQEYCEERLVTELREDPFSPCNVVLVVAPRQLLCQRIALHKTLDSTMVLLEQTATGVEVRSALQPFQCTVRRTETVLPDALVDTLLHESLQLHRLSGGVVPCAAVIHDMQRWLARQSANAVEAALCSAASCPAHSCPSAELDGSVPHQPQAASPSLSVTSSSPPPVRASSPSWPRSLCRREWQSQALPLAGAASAAAGDAAGEEEEAALEELLLPGSYPSSKSPVHGPRPSLLSGKGLVVPAQALAGASVSTRPQRAVLAGASTGAPRTRLNLSHSTSQLQQLLFTGLAPAGGDSA